MLAARCILVTIRTAPLDSKKCLQLGCISEVRLVHYCGLALYRHIERQGNTNAILLVQGLVIVFDRECNLIFLDFGSLTISSLARRLVNTLIWDSNEPLGAQYSIL